MSKKFGQFPSFDKFLESYKQAEVDRADQEDRELPFDERVRNQQDRLKNRAVVEVQAKLDHLEQGDGNELHVQMTINVTELVEGNAAVNSDVSRVMQNGEDVFVAVRTGDEMGIRDQIVGLVDGVGLHIRGEWIPIDKAFAHGGEKMSVLHFTHHPLGFICVAEPAKCYS